MHQKGFFDLEMLYKLNKNETVIDGKKDIADRIENPLQEGTPLF